MFLTTELKVTWGIFSMVEASWRKLIVCLASFPHVHISAEDLPLFLFLTSVQANRMLKKQ